MPSRLMQGRVLQAAFVLVLLLVAGAARAETANLMTGTAISPTSAWSYYGSATTHTTGVAAWSGAPPEIAALAQTLGANRLSSTQYAQNIFDYIRNNIETEFRFGLGKGGRGALIDQSGTPFDQAQLMVELLRAGGITASYEVGTITLTPQQFGEWTGLVENLTQSTQTFNVDALQACQFLADGGIPEIVNGSSSCSGLSGYLSSVTMSHIWVSALGNLYDPSFKVHTLKTGIDISNAMGCGNASAPTCGSSTVSAATSSSSTGTDQTGPYIQHINDTGTNGLNATLQGFAQGLQTYIQTNNRIGLIWDVVGGSQLTITPSPTVSSTISYIASTYATWTGDIPDQFRTTLRVCVGSNNSTAVGFSNGNGVDQIFYADELAGRRLQVVNGSPNMAFMVDETAVNSEGGGGSGCGNDTAVFDVYHPYAANSGTYGTDHEQIVMSTPSTAGFDESEPSVPITIIAQIGNSSQSAEQHLAAFNETNPDPVSGAITLVNGGGSNGGIINQSSYENDNQANLAGKLLGQGAAADRVIAGLGQARVTRQHDIGVVFAAAYDPSTTSYVSLVSSLSVDTTSSSSVLRTSVFETEAGTWAMLEGLVNAQTDFQATGLTAATYFWSNNTSNGGQKFYQIASGGSTDVYGGGGSLALSSTSIAYYIIGGAGGGSSLGNDPFNQALESVKLSDKAMDKKKYLSVSSADGGATIAVTDLETGVGGFPHSLPFTRTYRSGSTVSERAVAMNSQSDDGNDNYIGQYTTNVWTYSGPDSASNSHLGGGWDYNYDITARYSGDSYKGFGSQFGLEASTAIAALWSFMDAARSNTLITNRVTMVFDTYWLATMMSYNSVVVNKGGQTEAFQRLPDGSFNSISGADRLVQSGVPGTQTGGSGDFSPVTFQYTGKDGDTINFDWAIQSQHPYSPGVTVTVAEPIFKADNWTFPDGTVVTFNYTPYWLVTSWSTPQQTCTGVELGTSCFNEAAPYYPYGYVLTGVSNNLGRSLAFNVVPTNVTVNASSGEGTESVSSSLEITSVTDENERTVTYALSGCTIGGVTNRLACSTLKATAPDGAVTKYTYNLESDSTGSMASTYRLNGWYVPSNQSAPYESVTYDGLQRVATVTDADGYATSYYPGAIAGTELWKRADVVDPSPLSYDTSTLFDQWNSLLSSTDPLGNTTSYVYDNARRKTLETFPEGNSDAFTYDIRSNVLSTTKTAKPGCASPQVCTITTSMTYEGIATDYNCTQDSTTPIVCNKPASETDGNGQTTNYSWDSDGLIADIQLPADVNGNRPLTQVVYQTCDNVTVPLQKQELITATTVVITQYAFNASNKCVLQSAIVDYGGLGLKTLFTFDTIGDVTEIQRPRYSSEGIADISYYLWDTNNRRLTGDVEPIPTGQTAYPTTKYTYDLDGQPIETDVGTATSTTGSGFGGIDTVNDSYDPVGNKLEETKGPTGQGFTSVTQYSYDQDDRLSCTAIRMNSSALGSTSSPPSFPGACSLSTAGNFGPDRITQRGYDADGHTLTETRALNTSIQEVYATYTYTPNGKEASVYDADGSSHITNYAYDGFDRLLKTMFPDGTTEQIIGTSSQEGYDNDDNVLYRKNRAGETLSYTYDNIDRKLTKTLPAVGSIPSDTITYGYDLKNEVISISDNLGTLGNTYDNGGRITQTTQSFSSLSVNETVGYGYDTDGNRTSIAWPGSSYSVTYHYDAQNHMTSASDSSVTLANFGYDALGRRASVTYANSSGAQSTLSWTADSDLSSLVHTFPGASSDDVTYADLYTPAHQIYQSTISISAFRYAAPQNLISNYGGVNVLNEYPNVTPSGGSAATLSYDNNGNLTGDGTWSFVYDAENKLMTAGNGTGTSASYDYDATGRRAAKVVNGTTTSYLDDPAGDEIGEYSGSGSALRYYVPGPTLNDPIAMVTPSGTRAYFHKDKQGSVAAMSDLNGNVSEGPYIYDPYGDCTTASGPCGGGEPFLFAGMRLDPETGLYYDRARYYSPAIGRFLQTDPIGYKDDVDWYDYVYDDPTDRVDVSGNEGTIIETNTMQSHNGEATFHRVVDGIQTAMKSGQQAFNRAFPNGIGVGVSWGQEGGAGIAKGDSPKSIGGAAGQQTTSVGLTYNKKDGLHLVAFVTFGGFHGWGQPKGANDAAAVAVASSGLSVWGVDHGSMQAIQGGFQAIGGGAGVGSAGGSGQWSTNGTTNMVSGGITIPRVPSLPGVTAGAGAYSFHTETVPLIDEKLFP